MAGKKAGTCKSAVGFGYDQLQITAWKASKYEVFSGPHFSVLGLNKGKYGPQKSPYLHTFHAVNVASNINLI